MIDLKSWSLTTLLGIIQIMNIWAECNETNYGSECVNELQVESA